MAAPYPAAGWTQCAGVRTIVRWPGRRSGPGASGRSAGELQPGVVGGDDVLPERSDRDRGELDVGDPERDADDGEAEQDAGHDVGDGDPQPGQDEPDDVADGRRRTGVVPTDDRPAERPEH